MSQQTLPSDFTFRLEENEIRLAHVLRECHSNGLNYKATDALFLIAHHNPYSYLFYFDNANPFTDMEGDILKHGCTPNISALQGKSFQGAGLVASACALHPNPCLLVASVCPRAWKVGVGRTEGNFWITEDGSKEWVPIIQHLIGNGLKGKTVGYGFRFDARKAPDKRNFFGEKLMNMVAMMMLDLPPALTVHFCQKEIGYPYADPVVRKKYATYDAAVASGITKLKTGSMYRRALSNRGYLERFCEQSWTIPCEPFSIEIPSAKIALPVTKARIVIHYFPGTKSQGGEWMLNLRSGDTDGQFKQWAQNEFGKPPYRKAFLYCPWIHSWAEKNDAQHADNYGRFKDNSLYVYTQERRLIQAMGLPYSDGKNAFLTVQVFLEDLGTLTDAQGVAVPMTPHVLFGLLQRRSDFTFAAVDVMPRMILKAAEAAAKNVPDDLKVLCQDLFAYDGDRFIPLDPENNKVQKRRTRESNFTAYDLDDKGNIFSGKVKPGEKKHLVLVHAIDGPIHPKDVQCHPSTRGVDVSDVTDFIAHIGKCEEALESVENLITNPSEESEGV